MLERDRFQPGDADVDAVGVVAARQLQFLALRRAGADEHGIKTALVEQLPHARDGRAEAQVGAHADDIADLLVQHLRGQPE